METSQTTPPTNPCALWKTSDFCSHKAVRGVPKHCPLAFRRKRNPNYNSQKAVQLPARAHRLLVPRKGLGQGHFFAYLPTAHAYNVKFSPLLSGPRINCEAAVKKSVFI